MPACISISKKVSTVALLLLVLLSAAAPRTSWAAGGKDKLSTDDDDFSSTPFTDYGEFNQEADEEAETKFMQYGRLFGVSLGAGAETPLGNRGKLWQGGFPAVELNVHYWFDFNFALDLGFWSSKNQFTDSSTLARGNVQVSMTHIGADMKYYFDTKNLAAPISFANPYVLVGVGGFSKTETSEDQGSTSDSALALSAGLGLEFVLSPRKTYLSFEGKIYSATFQDTNTSLYQPNISDLSGPFMTFVAGVLFTW